MGFFEGEDPIVIFGDGANSGLFGRTRGAGVKGPILRFQRELAKRVLVILCPEYNSSAL